MAKIDRRDIRKRIHKRIRKKIVGTPERPRLSVCFTGRHVYAQIIEDGAGYTLTAASTIESTVRGADDPHANKVNAEKVGRLLAARAMEKQIKCVVFDRGGFQYHGKVKALADAARAGGLKF